MDFVKYVAEVVLGLEAVALDVSFVADAGDVFDIVVAIAGVVVVYTLSSVAVVVDEPIDRSVV